MERTASAACTALKPNECLGSPTMFLVNTSQTNSVQPTVTRSHRRSREDMSATYSRRHLPTMAADSITEDQFRAEAVAFLEANAKPRQEETIAWGEGSDKVGLLAEKTFEEELEEVRDAKAWRARVFDTGFGWITGP